MITKICENCGTEFETEHEHFYLCYPCWWDKVNARYMCHGTTKTGKPCRAIARINGFCFMHRHQAPLPGAIAVNSSNWLREIAGEPEPATKQQVERLLSLVKELDVLRPGTENEQRERLSKRTHAELDEEIQIWQQLKEDLEKRRETR